MYLSYPPHTPNSPKLRSPYIVHAYTSTSVPIDCHHHHHHHPPDSEERASGTTPHHPACPRSRCGESSSSSSTPTSRPFVGRR